MYDVPTAPVPEFWLLSLMHICGVIIMKAYKAPCYVIVNPHHLWERGAAHLGTSRNIGEQNKTQNRSSGGKEVWIDWGEDR